ncbi:PREDICTED: cytochrome P450 2A13-like, partial [Gekko japonicus]|uniref:Cytochrome P450 2A13-like n=1 Tax=Gekko japonicus TaxID=146911 RepID=A0ABM1K2G7_GEKJA
GTEVFPLLGSVLRDPKHFARPDVFDPQHFLDENGTFKRNDAFVPFSVGKRYCFGERLARMELFLFFTSILQNFRFKSPIPTEEIDISPMLVGFATIPHFYKISMIPR